MCPLEDETNSSGDNQIVTMEEYFSRRWIDFANNCLYKI